MPQETATDVPRGASDRATTPLTTLLTTALGVATLSCLTFAQPLLDLIAHQPELLTIRRLGTADVTAMLAGLLLLPLPALLLLGLVARWWPRWSQLAGSLLIGALCLPLLLQLLKGGPLDRLWPLAFVAAPLAAWAYYRGSSFRTFLVFLTPALLAVPLLFLLNGGVQRALGRPSEGVQLYSSGADAPIVFVLFDEWSFASILDADRQIDRQRLPNLARLADRATWYRNAVSVSDATELAVPAILTARFPREGSLPIFADHPINLFTLFGGDYSIFAQEPITELCPPAINGLDIARPAFGERMRSLLSDLRIVWLHQTLPERWSRSLPTISQSWSDFAPSGQSPTAQAASEIRLPADQESNARENSLQETRVADDFINAALDQLRHGKRDADFQRFVEQIRPHPRRTLHFIHSLLPHVPWEYLPSGRRYLTHSSVVAGLSDEGWSDDEGSVALAMQRYLLQVGFVDHLLGDLIDRLEQAEMFDRALIVVAADHGISFRTGGRRRFLDDRGNDADLAPVPLLIKAPGQAAAEVVDDPMTLVDVVPRVLELLGVEPPPGFTPTATAPGAFVGKYRGAVQLAADVHQRKYDLLERQGQLLGPTPNPFGLENATQLIGRSIGELGAVEGRREVRLDGAQLYDDVDPEQSFSLALLQGTFPTPDEELLEMPLAVAVNGVVVAISRPFRAENGALRFAVMAPEDSLAAGANRVEVFLVRRPGDDRPGDSLPGERVVLESIRSADVTPYRIVRDQQGEPTQLGRGRREIPLAPQGELRGFVERLVYRGPTLLVQGWAADTVPGQSLLEVVLFLGDRMLLADTPRIGHPSVAEGLGETYRFSGFRFEVRRADLGNLDDLETDGLRLFAVSRRGTASELGSFFLPLETTPEATLLRKTNGKVYRAQPDAVNGFVDSVRVAEDGTLEVTGWAAETDRSRPASSIVVFRDGELLRQEGVSLPRADVAQLFGRAEIENCGFQLRLPTTTAEELRTGRVRIFALSRGARASELEVLPFAQDVSR